MKLGISVGYGGAEMALPIKRIQRAEELGFDSVWTSETYGPDAITPLAYIAALTKRIRLGTSVAQIALAMLFLGVGAYAVAILLLFAHAFIKTTLQFARERAADLYMIASVHPAFGPLNGVEALMIIAGHAQRHAEQIREVRAALENR